MSNEDSPSPRNQTRTQEKSRHQKTSPNQSQNQTSQKSKELEKSDRHGDVDRSDRSGGTGNEQRGRSHEAKVRPSDNKGPDTTATLQPLANADAKDWLGSNQDPDVLLSVPNLGIDRIHLQVDNVKADVELHAKVLDLLELHVGAKASIDKVELEIDNVRVQAMLKVRLDKVVELVDSVVEFLDNHPEVLTNLTEGVGRGLEGALAPNQQGQDKGDGQRKQVGQGEGSKSSDKDGSNRQRRGTDDS